MTFTPPVSKDKYLTISILAAKEQYPGSVFLQLIILYTSNCNPESKV